MAREGDEFDAPSLAPDEAFRILGNATRIKILQMLGEAPDELSFTKLRERVGIDDPGQFNYHLNQLREHFVRRGKGGYQLREPGSIVVQAVLSGVITRTPVLESTPLDATCPYCTSPVDVSVRDDRVLVQCRECLGLSSGETDVLFLDSLPRGTVAVFRLPPAGLEDRSLREALDAAIARTHHNHHALAKGICPSCSADVNWTLDVCEHHDTSKEFCDSCHRRRALHVDYRCVNCILVEANIPAGVHLVQDPQLMSFIATNGVNPVVPTWEEAKVLFDYDEEIHSLEPLEARFTYRMGRDVLSLSVDEDLEIVDVLDNSPVQSS